MSAETLVPKHEVVVRREGEDAFLFDPETGKLLCVNRLGFFIWDALAKKRKKDDIIQHIFEDHEGAALETIRKDYERFVSLLRENAFLGACIT